MSKSAEDAVVEGLHRSSIIDRAKVVSAADRAGVRYDDVAACTYVDGDTCVARFLALLDGDQWGSEVAVSWSAEDISVAEGMGMGRDAYLESRIFLATQGVAAEQVRQG